MLKVLIAETNILDFNFIKHLLNGINGQSYKIEHIDSLQSTLLRLDKGEFDIILLNLNLSDSTGLDTLTKVYQKDYKIPILVLTELDDNKLALETVKRGAQDYIPKNKLNEDILFRIINYAIERNRIKIASQENKEKYSALFQNSNDGIFLHDLDGNILDVNKRAVNLLGYKKSELLSLKIMDLHPPNAFEACQLAFQKVVSKENALFEIEFKRKNGSIITAEVSANAIELEGKKVVQCIVRDITERKITEQQLRLQDKVLKSAANGIVVTDKCGTIIWINSAFTKLTGFKFEEAVGKNPRILKSGNHDQSFYKNMWDTILSGNIWDGELVNIRKDGAPYFESQTITPVKNSDGEITHFIGIKTDITEKKQAEDKLRASEKKFRVVTDTATEAIVTADSRGKITYINKCAERMFGYKVDKILNKSITLLMPDRFHKDHKMDLNRFLRTGESKLVGKTVEIIGRKKDGSEFPIEASLSSWMSAGETFFTAIISDITHRKEGENKLKESQERYYNLFNNSLNGFALHEIVINKKGKPIDYVFLEVNQAFEKITGLKSKDVIGKKVTEVIPGIEKDPFIEVYGKVALTGEPIHLEQLSSALNKHFEVAAFSPQKGQFAAIFTDITERKQFENKLRDREQKLRTIVEHSNELFYIHDIQHQLTYVSPQAKEIFGYTPNEMMVKWTTLTTDNPINEEGLKITEKAIKTGKTQPPYLLELKRKDGKSIIVEVDESPVKDNDGKVIGITGALRDITERKQAEEALKISEEKYRNLIDNTLVGIYKTNLQGDLLYVNKALAQIFEFDSPEEMMREAVLNRYLNKKDRQILLENLEKKGKVDNFEIEVVTKKEQVKSILLSSVLNGEELSGMIMDITQRKIAKEALKESEEKFKNLSEQSPNMIFINQRGRVVYANKKCEEIMGFSRDEFYSPDFNFLSLIAPESLELVKKNFEKHIEGDEIKPYEYSLVTKNGEKLQGIHTTTLINYQGEKAILGIITDITERKRVENAIRQSEEKYRTIFEESKDVIYISTPEGKFIDINPVGVELFGYDSKEELLKIDIRRDLYINPLDRQQFKNELINEGHVKDFEVMLKKKDGQKVIVLVTSTTVKNETGKIIGYRGIIRDITEKILLGQQLQQAQKMEAIGTLAGGIAHDFNNILGAILGYTELITNALSNDNNNPVVKRNLEQVYKAGLRAKDLVQQILTFSRKTQHKPQPLQIELIVKEALKLLRASIPVTIEIVQNIERDCGYILADPTQIHQVMMNLCTNAFDSMREKGGILNIELKQTQIDKNNTNEKVNLPAGEYVNLTISDTGHGIDDVALNRIFEPFFTTKEQGVGTGLGLAVVHGIVKSHGGEILVSSEVEKGTKFSIYLPVYKFNKSLEKTEEEELVGGNESILLVDDETALVKVGVQLLEKLGYNVSGYTSSDEALQVFRDSPDKFDIVISDQTMPKLPGAELANELLQIKPDIPIILITGFCDTIDKSKAEKMGIKELIMKPYLATDLSKIIRDVLDNQNGGLNND